jgi:homoserine O-acetyltransferase
VIAPTLADAPIGVRSRAFGPEAPLRLDCGDVLSPFEIAYETWGTLNEARTNAVLVCHALTGDQFVGGPNPITGKPGWWTRMIGPGKPIDTDRYFVICTNVLGGCMGSTGPASPHPEDGKPWGLRFPVITVADMVRAHRHAVPRHWRLDGRDAGAGMGRKLPGPGVRCRPAGDGGAPLGPEHRVP